jgi:hypothetical protein
MPSGYELWVRSHLTSVLKDPDSFKQFVMTNLYKGSLWRRAIGGGTLPVWVTCVTYNAKNSYGGYTGAKTIAYAFDRTGMFWVLDTADLRQGFHYTHCPRE